MKRNSERPTGRDAVRTAVLDAASKHFAARGARASLRDIAKEAGVNLGLIHRHFGNKDDLIRAVFEHRATRGRAVISETTTVAEAVRYIFEESRDEGEYFRMLAWMLLEHDMELTRQAGYPTISAMRRLDPPDADRDPRLIAAMAAIYGWSMYSAELLSAFGVTDDERRRLEARVAELLADLVTP